MHAIFEDGGKQYRVTTGDTLLIERRDLPEGQTQIQFENVLMVGDGGEARVGTPWVTGARVTAKLLEELKTPKVVGVKFRRRKGYRKTWGHRQPMLRVQIEGIEG